MKTGPRPPIVYGSAGGMPPRGLELLTIGEDRTARYLAANPWPVQAPFDEIGRYEASLRNGYLRDLERLIADLPDPGGGARSSDIRSDSLETNFGTAPRRWEWLTPAPPFELIPVVERLRRLIAETREHPVSTIRASIEVADRSLRLENRGAEPFRFYGFGSEAGGARAEVRVRARDRSAQEAGPGLPVGLVTDDPLEVSDPEGPGGSIELGPGSSISVSLSAIETDPVCLLRVCFPATSLDGEPFVQEGWILAHSGVDR